MATTLRKRPKVKPPRPKKGRFAKIIEDNIVGNPGWFEFEEVRYQYVVVRAEVEPDFPHFVRFKSPDEIYVSEAVPKKWRHYMLIHEFLVFETYSKTREPHENTINRLLDEVVPAHLVEKFAEYLVKHYDELATYLQTDEDTNDTIKQSHREGFKCLCQKVGHLRRQSAT